MDDFEAPLTRRLFFESVRNLGGDVVSDAWTRAYEAVRDAHRLRPYHSWRHVRHKLGWTYALVMHEEDTITANELAILTLADCYHDAAYETRPKTGFTNEEESGMLATAALIALGVDGESIAEVTRLIWLTARHRTMPHDRLGQIMIDGDLAILASPKQEYLEYASAIRQEYAWADTVSYVSGRVKVLREFLSRDRLFFSQALDEERGRANLTAEIEGLEKFGEAFFPR